ncbi:MAG: hypothetical protein ABSD13_01070 [Candidatus Korobacteraceae bacterium]
MPQKELARESARFVVTDAAQRLAEPPTCIFGFAPARQLLSLSELLLSQGDILEKQ